MSICSHCKAHFHCGVADGRNNEPCWCMALPPLPVKAGASIGTPEQCLCPQCLQALLAACGSGDHSNPSPECDGI